MESEEGRQTTNVLCLNTRQPTFQSNFTYVPSGTNAFSKGQGS